MATFWISEAYLYIDILILFSILASLARKRAWTPPVTSRPPSARPRPSQPGQSWRTPRRERGGLKKKKNQLVNLFRKEYSQFPQKYFLRNRLRIWIQNLPLQRIFPIPSKIFFKKHNSNSNFLQTPSFPAKRNMKKYSQQIDVGFSFSTKLLNVTFVPQYSEYDRTLVAVSSETKAEGCGMIRQS